MLRRGTLLAVSVLALALPAHAATITFDDLVTGATSYAWDADADLIDDVVFSTADPGGFNTVGPGTLQTYIDEPGLEGTALLDPDLRVDFVFGALNSLSFGFALDSGSESSSWFTHFQVFDSANNVLADSTVTGLYTDYDPITPGFQSSSFPEGVVSVTFAGTASYALFDFTSEYGRYIIDDFQGTYGSTEVPTVPVPGAAWLGLGLLALLGVVRSRRRT